MLTRGGSALASSSIWGTWIAPVTSPGYSGSTALQAVGMVDWAGTPLHLTVTDAASSRAAGFPTDPAYLLGTSALILCFSPSDRESFVAVQHLYQRVIAVMAPTRVLLVAVVDGACDRGNSETSEAHPGPSSKLKVGQRPASTPGILFERSSSVSASSRTVSSAEISALAHQVGTTCIEIGVQNPEASKLTKIIDLALGAPEHLESVAAKPVQESRPTASTKVALKSQARSTEKDADFGSSMQRGIVDFGPKRRQQSASPQRAKQRHDCTVV